MMADDLLYPLDIEIPSLKSLFIEMYFDEQILSSGTAILISENRDSHCVLITNRHNVTGVHQDTGECLSANLGIPNNILVYFHSNTDIGKWIKVKLPLYREDNSRYWIEHPLLGAKADLIALNLNWGADVLKFPYYLGLDLDKVDMGISPAEPVSVIGFPFGMSTSGKLPIWATGFLAQELSLVTKDNPVFLIDCRTRQGQSGSPVIAFRTSGYRKIEGNKVSSILTSEKKWEFLGIYSGRINKDSDLGKVWHVSVLRDLLKSAENEYIRRENMNLNRKMRSIAFRSDIKDLNFSKTYFLYNPKS